MAFDPDKLVNASKKIEEHLKNYEARRKEYEKCLETSKKNLETLDFLTKNVDKEMKGLIQVIVSAGSAIEKTLKSIKDYTLKTAQTNREYEQLQRRYLDSKKTMREVLANAADKHDAMRKNKNDKKAKLEYELAEKAAGKIEMDTVKLLLEAQELVPSKLARELQVLTEQLPQDIANYDKAVRRLLGDLDDEAYRRAVESLEKKWF